MGNITEMFAPIYIAISPVLGVGLLNVRQILPRPTLLPWQQNLRQKQLYLGLCGR